MHRPIYSTQMCELGDYEASLHAAFTVAEVRQQLADAGLDAQLQVAELDDRYLEVWGRLAG